MTKNIYTLLLSIVLATSGCDCKTEDQTKGASAVCEVHHTRMAKTKVPIEYGLIRLNEYGRARQAASTNSFPHAQECVLGGCIVGTTKEAVIYVCSDCQKALQQWEASRDDHKSGG